MECVYLQALILFDDYLRRMYFSHSFKTLIVSCPGCGIATLSVFFDEIGSLISWMLYALTWIPM